MQRRTALFYGSLASAFLLLANTGFSAPYGTAGCGLGSMLIKQKGIIQIFAATFNNSSGSQTFGISSGTSNCVDDKSTAQLKAQEQFFVANLSNLSKEIAQGEGETVRALTERFGCPVSSYEEVRTTLQQQHGYIFAAPGAIASLERTKKILREQAQLHNACQELS